MRLSPCGARQMLKWILTLVVAIFLLGIIGPHLAGDFAFRFRGRSYTFPVATTIIFSLLVWLLSRVI